MLVRILQPGEILPALHLIWEVYVSDVAPLQQPQAIDAFREEIRYENMRPELERGELVFFGAFEGNILCGTCALTRQGQIRYLFVRKEWQKKGVGRQLINGIYPFCGEVLGVTRLFIKAVPASVTALNRLGFSEEAPAQQTEEGFFVPMQLMVVPGGKLPKKSKRKVVMIAVGICFLIALLVAMIIKEVDSILEQTDTTAQESSELYGAEEVVPGEDSDVDSSNGLDQIPEYEEEDLPFEVTEETYHYAPDQRATVIQFEIYYPQLSGMEDEKIQEKVNEELKSCALETVDRIYDHPEADVKSRVLEENKPVLADFVRYKVTYLTEDYICVAYEDYSYEGNETYHYVGLRTKNINLKDGTVYEVSDIVSLNDTFLKKWQKAMQDEASDDTFLEDVDLHTLKEILSGESDKDGTFTPVFFADADGIEIGLSFHYDKEDPDAEPYAWVTAPYRYNLDSLKDERTDSTFWDLVK